MSQNENRKNKHIQLDNLNQLNKLDNLDFDKVIFFIGSSNHHEINLKNIQIYQDLKFKT